MSLINKMLQDLDARNASAAERAGLAPQLRALPPVRSFSWRAPAFVGLGAAAGAGAVWFALQALRAPQPAAPTPPLAIVAAAAPQPAAAPAAVPAPPMPALVIPLPAEPEAEPAKPAPSQAKGAGTNSFLKVERSLSLPPEAARAPAAAEAPPGPVQINKQPHATSGSEAADAEYRKAMAEVRRGALADGAAGLQRALLLQPRLAQARQALLSILVEQSRWAEAQTVCTEGLALDPAQAGWAMVLARLQVEKGETAQAAETLAQYAAHAERNADYQAFHALLLHKLQRPAEAAARYQAALALRPTEGRWWYGLGVSLEAAQKPQEARQAFQRASESGNLPPELAAVVEQKRR